MGRKCLCFRGGTTEFHPLLYVSQQRHQVFFFFLKNMNAAAKTPHWSWWFWWEEWRRALWAPHLKPTVHVTWKVSQYFETCILQTPNENVVSRKTNFNGSCVLLIVLKILKALCVKIIMLFRNGTPLLFAECSGSYITLQITELGIWEVPKIIILVLFCSLKTPHILSSISKSHHSFV